MKKKVAALILAAAFLSGACSTGTDSIPEGDPAKWRRPVSADARVVAANESRPILPGHIYIPTIDVNANVMSLPTVMRPAPFLGGQPVSSFGVPTDMAQTAWWSDGPAIGTNAMAVIVGHAQVNGPGVFNELGRLEPGAEIIVENEDGTEQVKYRVSEVVDGLAKSDSGALQQTLSSRNTVSQLALITCGGEFDESVSQSDENIVVFAVRI